MTAFVLPRLYAGWWPLIRALGIVCTAFGLGLVVLMARGTLWPIPPGPDADAMVSGSIAFLLSGILAALLAGGAGELRASTFAWNTPQLARRVRREITVVGCIVLGVGAGAGAQDHGALTGESWFLAIAAALGFSVGLVNSLGRIPWALGGTIGVLLAALPIFFMPELARWTAHSGFLWAMLAAFVLMVTTSRCGDVLARRGDTPDDREDSGLDARLFATATPLRRAPRDGADRFRGVRQSDLDWVQASLHGAYGAGRGGLLASAIRVGIATVVVTLLVRLFFNAIGNLRAVDATTGATPTQEIISFTVVQQGLCGFSLEWFTRPFASRQEELFAVNLVAVILGTVLWNRMASSSAFHFPISRRRLAWVAWLRTQVEDLAAAGGVLAGFVAIAIVAARTSRDDPWPNLVAFAIQTAAVFTLLPVARWMRLRWVDSRRPVQPRHAATEAQDPWLLMTYAVSMGVVIGGATLLSKSLQESAAWLRAETPEALHAWIPLLALVPIALLRWLWLVELRRYYRRSDLA